MAIASTTNQIPYTGDGVSVAFAYSSPFITAADIKVSVAGVIVTTGYTVTGTTDVTGNGAFISGTVTFSVAPASGVAILLYCDPDLLQTSVLLPNDPLPAKTVEKMVDKVTLQVQRLRQSFSQSVAGPLGEVMGGPLPTAGARLDKLSAFDATTGAPVVTSFTVTQVSAAITAAANAGSYLTTDTVLFLGGFGGDDGLALQTLAHFNQARRIINVLGNTLNFYTACTITDSGGTVIDGNGGTVIQHTPNIDSFVYQPLTVGVTAAFLNFTALVNITISHTAVVTAGSTSGGLRATQCNGFRCIDVTFSNADVVVAGCQLWSFTRPKLFANAGSRGIDSACMHIQDAPYGAGQFQQCFTGSIDDWRGSAAQTRGAIFRVHSVDGLRLGYGYGTSGSRAIVNILADRGGSYVSNVSLGDAYLDCGPSGGSPFGVLISADAFSSSPVYSVIVSNCWIANGSLSGVCNRKTESYMVSVTGGEIANFTSYGIDHSVSGNNTNLLVQGVQFSGNGANGISGDIRADGGNSVNVGPNTYANGKNVCVIITGSWVTGNVTPGTNATGVAADIAYTSATFSGAPFTMSAGASSYVGVIANSWRVGVLNLTNYANNAAAVAAGLQANRPYRTGNAQMIV